MGFKGMDDVQAPKLAAAVDVMGGALTIQGGLINGILEKWEAKAEGTSDFPKKASWATDEAKDIRRRLGIAKDDPEAVLTFAGLAGALETWKEFQEGILKDIKTPLKVLKIPTAIEASLHLYARWAQGQNVAGARAVWELNKYFGSAAERIKATRGELLKELLKDQKIRNWYKEPWKWQQAVRRTAMRLKIPYAAKLFTKAPGTSALARRVFLPLSIVHGVKQMFLPDHKGAYGMADRGMGLLEAGGAAAVLGGASAATALGASATVAAAVPVVGWVALGVAGAYFLGSWAWDKWGDDIKSGAKQAWKATKEWGGKVKDKGKEIVDGAKSAVTNLVPNAIKKYSFW
ncbi:MULTISPECIES: hypothetical protein [Streptomyces]|uniref:hypothetical protein n=1 Tax=Streptomyces TaxID=1883 RepID=UPI00074A5808|nr:MULTISPECIES: hypothetical protein [Streptomyces]KUL54730.1 hypothetical protein ADL30_15415 [Streptomyces sp. NRRL S-1521]QUI33264.1 hypothetical protein H9W91_22175 [Streptomyces alfalfae]THC53376.1 hypothetical protein E7X58_09100 [Streptomyces sp. A1499]